MPGNLQKPLGVHMRKAEIYGTRKLRHAPTQPRTLGRQTNFGVRKPWSLGIIYSQWGVGYRASSVESSLRSLWGGLKLGDFVCKNKRYVYIFWSAFNWYMYHSILTTFGEVMVVEICVFLDRWPFCDLRSLISSLCIYSSPELYYVNRLRRSH